MAKALKTVAVIAGGIALVATGVGALAGAGVIAASAGTLATVATIGTIASAVGAIASIGANLLAKKPKAEAKGTQTSFILDPDGPIPYPMGRAFMAGRAVHRETWGKDNIYQGFVSVLGGGGPHHSLDTFLVNQEAVNFSGGSATGRYAGYMSISSQLGQTPETSALQPAGGFGSMPGWTIAHKLSGLAADLWVIKLDEEREKYAGGVPKRGWVGRWAKVYDPRKDSTYPGGSGAHRWNDESTWEYDPNPWLNELTWEIGRRCANAAGAVGAAFAGSLLYLGVGTSIDKIDLPSYVYAANVADANGWEVSGVVLSSEAKWTVSKTIALAGGGEPIRLLGKTSAFIQSPKVAAETITKADLIGPCSIPSSPSYQDRINRIVPKYVSEDNGWEMVPASPVGVDAWRILDGGNWRTEEQPYRLVSDKDQAAQLALYAIADSRERHGIVLALKQHWKGYSPGSAIMVDVPEYGLNNQKCIVLDRQEDAANRAVILTLRTEDDTKHPLALAGTGVAPAIVDLTPDDPAVIPEPISGAWSATGGVVGDGSNNIPAIFVSGAVDNPNASQVQFDYRAVGDTAWLSAGIENTRSTGKQITSIAGGADYEVAVSYIVRGVQGSRRILPSVTSGILSVDAETLRPPTLPDAGSALPGRFYQPQDDPRRVWQASSESIIAGTYNDTSNYLNRYTSLDDGGAGMRDGVYTGRASVHGTNAGGDEAVTLTFTSASLVAKVTLAAINGFEGWNSGHLNYAVLEKEIGGNDNWVLVATINGMDSGLTTKEYAVDDTVTALRVRKASGFLGIGDFYASVGGGWRLVATDGATAGSGGNLTNSNGDEVSDADVAVPVLNSDGTASVTTPAGPISIGAINALDLPNGPAEAGATNTTNTNQLTDGANLGGTAAWGGTTGRPAHLIDTRIPTALSSAGRLNDATNMFTAYTVGVRSTTTVSPTAADAGSSASVTIPTHTRRIPGVAGSVSRTYNSGTITGLSFSQTYFIYCDDAGFAGGAVTYIATTDPEDLTANAARVLVGSVTTPADGGSTTTGGGSTNPDPPPYVPPGGGQIP